MLGELSETQAMTKIIILSVYLIVETSLTAVIVSNMFMCLFLSKEAVDKMTPFFESENMALIRAFSSNFGKRPLAKIGKK